MTQLQKTFDDINVSDIFHNCLTTGQRKEFCSIVDDLVRTRHLLHDVVRNRENRPIYTCNKVNQRIYDLFISIAIPRTKTFKSYQTSYYPASFEFDLLKVDKFSSYQSDNQLRLMVLEKLIGLIRDEQAGWKNDNE